MNFGALHRSGAKFNFPEKNCCGCGKARACAVDGSSASAPCSCGTETCTTGERCTAAGTCEPASQDGAECPEDCKSPHCASRWYYYYEDISGLEYGDYLGGVCTQYCVGRPEAPKEHPLQLSCYNGEGPGGELYAQGEDHPGWKSWWKRVDCTKC